MGRVLVILCLFLSGCGTLSVFPKSAPQEPRKMFNWNQTESIKPLVVGTIDGNPIVAYQQERIFTTEQQETKASLTFMQKVGRFIGGLTVTTIIFIVLALVFFGGTPIVWAVRKYFAVKSALKSTVAAIREIPTDDYEKIKPVLAQKHDKTDRQVIDSIKKELHKQ